ncbi:GGDEF domain-containing protein [Desulfurobacterium sp.]
MNVEGLKRACRLTDTTDLEGLRQAIFYYLLLAGILTVPVFGALRNYIFGKYVIVEASLIAELILLFGFFLYKIGKYGYSKLTLMFAVAVILLGVVFQNVPFMYMWLALFPALAFILFPSETALFLSFFFGIVVFVVDFLFHRRFSSNELYFLQEMLIFYLFMIAGGFLYAKVMEKQQFLLKWLTSKDELTGAVSRARFLENLEKEIPRSKRYGIPASLIMFDIDNFREVNKTFGYEVGNTFLRQIVKAIEKNVRGADIIVRWGDDEFVVFAPHTDIYGAIKLAEKLKRVMDGIFAKIGGKITVSMGVTSLKNDDTMDELLRRLDEALYLAKNRGGNRIESLE